MKGSIRESIRQRAGQRCEYCHMPESAAPAASFHLEHAIAKQHGGGDTLANFCWSCHRCNLSKGPNLSGRDPLTGKIVRLFHPRRQSWKRHFEWSGAWLVGRTACGRATIVVLAINHPQRVLLRQEMMNTNAGDDE